MVSSTFHLQFDDVRAYILSTIISWRDNINDIYNSSSPSLFYCTSTILMGCFFWWVAINLLSSSAPSSSSSNPSNTNNFFNRLFGPWNSSVLLSSAFKPIDNTTPHNKKSLVPPNKSSSASSLWSSPQSSKHSISNSHHYQTNNNTPVTATATTSITQSLEVAFNDLAPPFSLMKDVTEEEVSQYVESPDVTHFCFLIHGHRGLSKDLAYMQTVMQRWVTVGRRKTQQARQEQQQQQQTASSITTSDGGDSTHINDNGNNNNKKKKKKKNINTKLHDLVVHNAVCNEGKTTDGVENGGNRLVEEMLQVIDTEMQRRHPELAAAGATTTTTTTVAASRGGQKNIMNNNVDDEKENNDTNGPTSTRTSADGIISSNVDSDNNNEIDSDKELYDITISILGNSLGGLFGRYAIAKLVERHCVRVEKEVDGSRPSSNGRPMWILDGKYRVQLNIFCTTATPHLGVSGHTWVKIPRSAEIGVAHAMGQSGKDLFRVNDLLHTMATSPTFLGPLGAFRKRIAYANCYGTDFVVPVGTAAFLSEKSDYPHHFLTEEEYVVDDNDMVIAALHTPVQYGDNSGINDDDNDSNDVNDDDDGKGSSSKELDDTEDSLENELHQMSSSLDRLGWKKVLVDVRKELPCVELPKSLRMRRLPSDNRLSSSFHTAKSSSSKGSRASRSTSPVNSIDDDGESTSSDEGEQQQQSSSEGLVDFATLHELKKQKVVGSKDIASAVKRPVDNRVALPLGHNMVVAFSRSRFSTFMNKGGRPVVDALGKELVESILSWDNNNVDGSTNQQDGLPMNPSSSSTTTIPTAASSLPSGMAKTTTTIPASM